MTSAEHTIDLDAPWEPRTFAVGERVRVRISGECRARFRRYAQERPTLLTQLGHFVGEDGQTGTIISPHPAYDARLYADHPYRVRFDRPIRTEGVVIVSCGYAGTELEPLEATS